MEWDQVVEKISVSSNNSQLPALIDHSTTTFWQSSGQQNKVNVCVCMRAFIVCVRVFSVCVCVCVQCVCVRACVQCVCMRTCV